MVGTYLDQKVVVKIVGSGALLVLVLEAAAFDKVDTLLDRKIVVSSGFSIKKTANDARLLKDALAKVRDDNLPFYILLV